MREIDFMQFMWDGWEGRWGQVRCLECEKVLRFHPNCCAHILSKGSFRYFKTDMRNLIPLCQACHYIFDRGSEGKTRKDMEIWDIVEPIIKELKLEYAKLFR